MGAAEADRSVAGVVMFCLLLSLGKWDISAGRYLEDVWATSRLYRGTGLRLPRAVLCMVTISYPDTNGHGMWTWKKST